MILSTFFIEYNCYPEIKKMLSSLGTIPVVDTINGPVDYVMIAIIIFNTSIILSSLYINLIPDDDKTNEVNGNNSKIEFLKTYLEEKKEALDALTNNYLNIQDNDLVQSDSTINTDYATDAPITVDDTDALKELQELIQFSYDLGYNLKLYYELYQKGELEKELKNNNHTDSEIKYAKKYLEKKGPTLVRKRSC